MPYQALPDLVEEIVPIGRRELSILRPHDVEALIDEKAFEREEFLPYWGELWPSGVALARLVSARSLRGARVVELGCGLALPSVAAALAGGRALATDWSPDAIALARLNAERNGAAVEAGVVSWDDPGPVVVAAPWDLVLAADVLYERRNVDLLLDLLPRLVDERGQVLLADPGRPPARAFLERAQREWSLDTRVLPGRPAIALHGLRKRHGER